MQRDQLQYDVNETPPTYICIIMAITHVLLIFDATIFIPNVLGKTVGLPQDTLQFMTFSNIILAAIFTYIQSTKKFGIGSGFILFSGSYSAFLLCSVDAVNMGGLPLLASVSLLTVPIVFLYTFFIRFLRHIITPAVGGVVVLLIAVSLIPLGLDLWAGSHATPVAGMVTDGTYAKLGVGIVTMLTLTVLMLFGNNTLKMWSPILAMGSGYVVAFFTGELHFINTMQAPWLGLPPVGAWPGLELDISSIHIPLIIAFSMAMLASTIENTGNIMLVQQISVRNFRSVSYDSVQGGLYCDGASKIAAGLMGTAVPSVYCDNLPLIEMTGIASKKIAVYGSGILFCLAFMPKISGVILDMPGPVLGGFTIVIAALLFHAGIGLVTMSTLSNQHGLILGLSLTVGLIAESGTYFPNVVPAELSPLLQNSVAIGGFTAFFLSTLAYLAPKKTIVGTFYSKLSALPEVQNLLEQGKNKLQLSTDEYNHMALCYEEVFCHMVEESNGDAERKLTIRSSRTEEGIYTEIVSGHKMDDINNFAVPDSFFNATSDELNKLGLIIFSQYARDVKHIEISGYSYISFLL
ncbi:MAG: uracil-xanthine permease family protein [Desulfovibrio sp.]